MDRDFGGEHGGYEGGRGRGRTGRRAATDYGSTIAHWMQNRRPKYQGNRGFEAERPSASYIVDMLPPATRKSHAADTIPAKHLHSSLNKMRHPINVVKWTPEGRRLLTGSASGEFTLWNGTGFNFEMLMQYHNAAVRALQYSHSDDWLLTADQDGMIGYFQPNFNQVKEFKAHGDPIRDLAFAPTDSKFVTASDDASLKIWDFASGAEESVLTGHQWDVKSCDWHPTKGLLVSGSKDHQVKLWDPRTGRCLTTLHGHKNTIAKTLFEPTNGVLLASCARDNTARIFDIRMMRDVFLLRGNEDHITTLAWHPIHSNMLSTGANNGAMLHYLLDEQNAPAGTPPSNSPYDSPNSADAPAQTVWPAHTTRYAHDYPIWSMDWHPLGHILASGANDRATRFWTRPRPGDSSYMKDRWHIGQAAAEAQGTWQRQEAARQNAEEEEDEAEGLVDQQMPGRQSMLPGLPGIALPMPRPFPDGTSTGGAQPVSISMPGLGNGPPMPFPMPGGVPPPLPPGVDIERIKQMMASGQLPMPPLPGQNGAPGFPPLPGFQGLPVPPQNFTPPAGFPGMPPFGQPPQSLTPNGGTSVRKRAPLPSQQESLQAEMRQGKYVKPR